MLDQHELIEHTTGPAISIDERVDCLELVMRDGHANQGIDLRLLMNESLPVGELFAQQGLPHRRGIDHGVPGRVGKRCARHAPDFHVATLDGGTNRNRRGRAERLRFEGFHALTQRSAVTQRFLGGGVGILRIYLSVPEQSVGRRNDVLDFGTGLCFQYRDRIDQHTLVGNQRACLAQRRYGGTGTDAGLEDCTGFDVRLRRQQGQRVIGSAGVEPGHVSKYSLFIDTSPGHVERFDISPQYVEKSKVFRHIA